jgi:hypothetical protein
LRRSDPELARRLRLVFVGTSNQPGGRLSTQSDHRVSLIAGEEGVSEIVHEYPLRVAFLDALSILANSHANLLIGSDEAHYTASKIYPALMSGQPYLSLFHNRSSSHQILRRAGAGLSFDFETLEQLYEQVPAISQALGQLARKSLTFAPADPASYSDFTANAVSAGFADALDQMTARAGR